jgi:hypothetical protein
MNGNMGDFRIGQIATEAVKLLGGFSSRLKDHSPIASPPEPSAKSDRFIGRALAQAPDGSVDIKDALGTLKGFLGKATRPPEFGGFSTSA